MRTGSRQKSKVERYKAVQEWQVAIYDVARAMETADTEFIARAKWQDFPPLTWNMRVGFERYIAACKRLRELDAKEA